MQSKTISRILSDILIGKPFGSPEFTLPAKCCDWVYVYVGQWVGLESHT